MNNFLSSTSNLTFKVGKNVKVKKIEKPDYVVTCSELGLKKEKQSEKAIVESFFFS